MQIGVHLPQWGRDATRGGVLDVARAAEEAGLDSVWLADHIVYPTASDTTYPYSKGGLPFKAEDGFLEALTTLAVVAGATQRVKLGTSVLVLPLRSPLLVAKTVATLDVLSEGRMILGVGSGWWRNEFVALNEAFGRRGERLDEQIQIVRQSWRTGRVEHRGEFYDFDEVACEPRPVQNCGPKILIGGTGSAARRRAALLGDGWHSVGSNPDALRTGIADVRRQAREAGRDPSKIMLSTSTGLPASTAEAVERLASLASAGVGHTVLNVPSERARDICAAIGRLASVVLPEVEKARSVAPVESTR